jgi:hypothetical protein
MELNSNSLECVAIYIFFDSKGKIGTVNLLIKKKTYNIN